MAPASIKPRTYKETSTPRCEDCTRRGSFATKFFFLPTDGLITRNTVRERHSFKRHSVSQDSDKEKLKYVNPPNSAANLGILTVGDCKLNTS